MGNEDFKIDLDFDLSKYNYESNDKPRFTLDDILGTTSDDLKAVEETYTAEVPEISLQHTEVAEESAELSEEISAPADHSVDTSAETVTLPIKETSESVEKETEAVFSEETVKVDTKVEDKVEPLTVAKEEKPIEETVSPTDEEVVDDTPVVNADVFDKIKAKNKELPVIESDTSADEEEINAPEEAVEHDEEEEVVAEDRMDVISDLKRLRRKITAKAVIMFLLLLCSAYLTVCRISFLQFCLPLEINPSVNPFNYAVVLLGLVALCFLINISPLFDGFKKVFSARMTADGVAFFLGLVCILFDVYFVLNPEKILPLSINFDIMFILMLLMNLMGKRLLVKHVLVNFEMISQDSLKSVVSGPYGVAIDNDIMIETGNGGDVLYASKTKMVADYMRKAFAEQNVNRKTDVFYFVAFSLLTLFGILLWLMKAMELQKLVILLTAACSICAPVFSTWTHMLATYRLGKFLRNNQTMISGREGASAMSDSGVLVVRDTDLLSCDDINLRAMNVRDGYDSEEIMKYLAALFAKVGGPLEGFFDKILSNADEVESVDVADVYYHEQLGYTFVINQSNLAVGTDEFMRQCRIDCPINPAASGSERIYVAVDGQLVGVFSLTYKLSKKAVDSLQLLEDEGVSVAIITTDFNLRETMFNSVVYDPDMITILSNETAINCMTLCSDSETCPAEIVTYDDITGMALGIAACNKLLFNCQKHSIYRITASVFGILIIILLGFLVPMPSFWLPFQIMIYQFVWSIPNFLRGLRRGL